MGAEIDAGGRLIRPRLLERLGRAGPGATVLFRAPHFSGTTVLVAQWLEHTGLRAVWWRASRPIPSEQHVPAEPPDVVVVSLTGGERDTPTLAAWRELCPAAVLVVRHPLGMPPGAARAGVVPDVTFNGGDLLFAPDEVRVLAAARGIDLASAQVNAVLARSSGFALYVDETTRAGERFGALDAAAFAAAGDATVSRISAYAADGMVSKQTWQVVLFCAYAGSLSSRALGVIAELSAPLGAAVRTLRDAAMIVEDDRGGYGLPLAITLASERRLASEVPVGQIAEFLELLEPRMADAGLLAELVAWSAPTRDYREGLLARHWDELVRLPAETVRSAIADLGTARPELRLAYARALIDVAHAGHSGRISVADLGLAKEQLAAARAAADEDATWIFRTLLASTEAIAQRIGGDAAGAKLTHEALQREVEETDPMCGYVAVHAGISALETGDFDTALRHFAQVRVRGTAKADETLAGIARDLEMALLGAASDTDAAHWWRRALAAEDTRAAGPEFTARIRRLWQAVHSLDVDGMRAELARPLAVTADDPLTAGMIEAAARAIAAGLLRSPGGTLRELDIIDAWVAEREILPHHTVMLAWARVEALGYLGRWEEVIDICLPFLEFEAVHALFGFMLARAYIGLGDPDTAERYLSEAPGDDVRERRHSEVVSVAWCLIALERGERAAARQHIERAIDLGARSGDLQPFAAHGPQRFAELITLADELHLEQTAAEFVAELRAARTRLSLSGPSARLTPRQEEIMRALPRVESTRQLASALHLSPNTVKTQLRHIYRKLGVSSWREAAAIARSSDG